MLRPTGCPTSSAMRAANARAASRRGCVCAIKVCVPRPISRQYCGNCVLLPEPVSPATISTGLRRSASMMASRFAEIGKSGSCLKTSPSAPRAAAAPRSLATLDFLPKPLLALEVQVRKNCAALRRQGFHAAKSTLELGVGGAQRRLGIDIEFACQIGGREQQIADFFEDLRRWARTLRGRSAHLRELFGDLVGGLARMFEIKAHARRPLAELVGAHQRRQRLRYSIQMAVLGIGGAALGRLDFLPRDALFGWGQWAACA